jgi:hypothetical protein
VRPAWRDRAIGGRIGRVVQSGASFSVVKPARSPSEFSAGAKTQATL